MLKIRLQRYGRTNDPSFRVVVLESTRGPKAGNHVEQIGFYNAATKQKSLDVERAAYWMSKGAQPSDTVYNMLVTAGAISGKKRNVLPKKSPIIKEEPAAAAAPAVTSAPETPAVEAEAVTEAPAETPSEEAPVEASTEAPAEAPATEEGKTE